MDQNNGANISLFYKKKKKKKKYNKNGARRYLGGINPLKNYYELISQKIV